MYNDLAEHFSTIVALLILFAGTTLALLRHFFIRMEKKVDEISNSFSKTVTRDECEHRHEDLLKFVQVLTGITNCKTCKGEEGNEHVRR